MVQTSPGCVIVSLSATALICDTGRPRVLSEIREINGGDGWHEDGRCNMHLCVCRLVPFFGGGRERGPLGRSTLSV